MEDDYGCGFMIAHLVVCCIKVGETQLILWLFNEWFVNYSVG